MTTYATGNPIGSSAPKDLYDNAQNLDYLLLGDSPSYPDRKGKRRQSWAGIETMVSEYLESLGFEATHLTYVDGTPLTVLRPTQLIDRAGSVYKVKMPASFPVTLSGTWATDQNLLVDVGDAALRSVLLGPNGDGQVGTTNSFGVVSTVGARFDLIDKGTIYSDDPLYAGNVQAAADAMGANTVFVMRGTINLSTHLKFFNKVNPVVVFMPDCRVVGVRPFNFDAGLRGILDFYQCSNPIVYRPNITGVNEVKVFPATIPSLQEDGDSGIEFIGCSGSRVIGEGVGKLDYFMGWGIIHVGCTDFGTEGNTVTRCTQQSGVGHAGCQVGYCRDNSFSNIGLYGVEIEGDNTDIWAYNNRVDDVQQGVCIIRNAKNCRATGNRISRAVYGMTSNSIGTADSVNVMSGNFTYDCLMHFQIARSHFLTVSDNQSYSTAGVATAYLHQRAVDYVWIVLDANSVIVPDFASSSIVNGQIHQYVAAGAKTVQSFASYSDATMGTCVRITYNEGTAGMITGDRFRRFTDLQGSDSRWMYAGGLGLDTIEIHNNVANVASRVGVAFAGAMDGLNYSNNKIRGVQYCFSGEDATPITNSSINIGWGDCVPGTAMFLGSAQAKLFPSIKAQRHSFTMGRDVDSGFRVSTGSTLVRVKLLIFGSSAASAPVTINMNANPLVSIPAAEFGTGGLVFREVVTNLAAGFYTFTITGGGAMTISSASFEAIVVEI